MGLSPSCAKFAPPIADGEQGEGKGSRRLSASSMQAMPADDSVLIEEADISRQAKLGIIIGALRDGRAADASKSRDLFGRLSNELACLPDSSWKSKATDEAGKESARVVEENSLQGARLTELQSCVTKIFVGGPDPVSHQVQVVMLVEEKPGVEEVVLSKPATPAAWERYAPASQSLSVAPRFRLRRWGRGKLCIHLFLRTLVVRALLLFSLLFALFAPSIWIFADVPDDPGNLILDVIFFVIMAIFTVEIVMNYVVDAYYRFSFFFWMDVLGTLSIIFELSYVKKQFDTNAVVLRTARVAKLGARAGRLSKLLKCLSMMYKDSSHDGQAVEAKVLAQRLMVVLSTKVSAIVIVIVMLLPLFALPVYPTVDMSLEVWPQRLEE
ncbi:unnamed protein product, partial [Polarella glacialis]